MSLKNPEIHFSESEILECLKKIKDGILLTGEEIIAVSRYRDKHNKQKKQLEIHHEKKKNKDCVSYIINGLPEIWWDSWVYARLKECMKKEKSLANKK